MAPFRNKTFAEATTLKAQSSHTYEADFCDSWCIGSGTNNSQQHKEATLTNL
jgi:hypothetical protein